MLQSNPSQIEYIVYAYGAGCAQVNNTPHNKNENKWQRLMSGHDVSEVLARAEHLFHSRNYRKIEIKKTYFDKKKGHHRAATFRVLEQKVQNNAYFLSIAMMFALISLGLFYLHFS